MRIAADNSSTRQLGLERHGYVIALASLQAHKNIAVLLKAFARPELAGLKLVLFGGAGRADFVAAGHEVPANVVFAGRVSDGELRGLIEQALCLAFPSTTEGFGLPPLEAMLLGCPAVVAPCGAMPEVCGAAASYAQPDDVLDWTWQIANLTDNPGRRQLQSDKGRQHAAEFTWRQAAITLARRLSQI